MGTQLSPLEDGEFDGADAEREEQLRQALKFRIGAKRLLRAFAAGWEESPAAAAAAAAKAAAKKAEKAIVRR